MGTCNSVTVNTSTNTVTVNQGTTKVVTVNSIGPQGPVGPAGGGGGGSTSPGGSDTQVQFNDGGSFGGDTGFTFNKTTNAITAISEITSSGIISSSNSMYALSFIGSIDGGGF